MSLVKRSYKPVLDGPELIFFSSDNKINQNYIDMKLKWNQNEQNL